MFLLGRYATFLRDDIKPADDSTGTGDGGGTGANPGSSLTEEDVGRIVNKAVTSQLSRSLPKVIGEALGKLDLSEHIKEHLKTIQPEGGDEGKKPKGPQADDAMQKQLQKVAEDLEKERAARLNAEQARQESENQRALDGGRSKFRDAAASKVKGDLLDVFVDHFSTQLLHLNEDGQVMMKTMRSPYPGAPEEETLVPLQDGLDGFLESKQVQPFLPAPGAPQGDGKGSKRPAPRLQSKASGGEPSDQEVLEQLRGSGVDLSGLL